MKKPGLIGGIGPESTVVYYRSIIKKYQEAIMTGEYPEFIINSVNMREMLGLIDTGDYRGLIAFLVKRLRTIEESGADFAAIASNTPHIVFDQVSEIVDIPLISIVEETIKVIKMNGIDRVVLFGTRSTMTAGFYSSVAEKNGIEIIVPGISDCEVINRIYMNELVFNIRSSESKNQLTRLVNNLEKKERVTGLILGGTELPLILSQDDFPDLMVFDTTDIHVSSIVDRMITTSKQS